MEEVLLFIEANQRWIFLLLGLLGLVYFGSVLRAYNTFRAAIYGLERERSLSKLRRSGGMLALAVTGIIVVFILTTFASPALPASLRPTAIPTVSLLATPILGQGEEGTAFSTATPIDPESIDGTGCANLNAQIISPASGERVQGEVHFLGTANIPGFAFYKLEYHDLKPSSTWLAISANNKPVCEQGCDETVKLGTWDTSLVRPGQYAVQLVVTDTLGNAPFPCQIRLQIVP
ncbi:MAG: hypothetical protein E3J30_00990 [Anaerolineales bacterium]|nr:MAG: hypothetical protein E3J30_00990 [Anaerolineales bacterium]